MSARNGKDGDGMIELGIDAGIATAVLDRPPVNAINADWIERLNRVLDAVEARPEISVLHVRSALKAFCAGADLRMMRALLDTAEGRDAMIGVVGALQGVLSRLEAIPAVTVAEIGGAALGGGLEAALACDLRIAAEDAKLGLPEVTLGLLPGAGGTQRLPRICGEAFARRMILGGEVIDGREAARFGLVHWAVPADRLSGQAADIVRRLGTMPPEALAACKRCIAAASDGSIDGFEMELAETRRLHDGAETQRRVRAFLEGRR